MYGYIRGKALRPQQKVHLPGIGMSVCVFVFVLLCAYAIVRARARVCVCACFAGAHLLRTLCVCFAGFEQCLPSWVYPVEVLQPLLGSGVSQTF